ncbi:MAG: FKBP-type peptidyl-prolyl cis-trans isomerase [DPANN group archaeon]|nr:FKBP-type peptidyl-prolyl cis-trans isomerase [DPANN group archaeon]
MKDNDFISIEYVGTVKETGKIFDLTDEKIAKENEIYNPTMKYGPITIIIGGGFILKGLEAEMKNMKIGDKKTIELKPENAFGQRNPELTKVFNMKDFKKQGVNPIPGKYLDLGNGQRGHILSVNSGRVKIDFNHPLAEKTLIYDIKINEQIKDTKEQIKAIVSYYISAEVDVEIVDKSAKIIIPNTIKTTPELKNMTANKIIQYISDIKKIEFVEIYKKTV